MADPTTEITDTEAVGRMVKAIAKASSTPPEEIANETLHLAAAMGARPEDVLTEEAAKIRVTSEIMKALGAKPQKPDKPKKP